MASPHHRNLRPARATRAIAAAALVLALPSAAHATTTVSRSGNTITMTGDAAGDSVFGAGDDLSQGVGFFGHTDDTLRAGAGCHFAPRRDHGGHRLLLCGALAKPNNPLTLNADLGAGDDQLNLAWLSDRAPRAVVNAGDGNDLVLGTILDDELHGGPGNDDLEGGVGIDTITGDEGDDKLLGGPDPDVIAGGPGVDQLFGDAAEGVADPFGEFAGSDVIDATDYPSNLAGYTPEQILALGPQADQVSCGPGGDDAVSDDALDVVAASCEIRRGANPTPDLDHTPQLPFEQVVGLRPRYSLTKLLRGEPVRFVDVPSAAGFISATLRVSASDARRFHLSGNGASQQIIGAARPVVLQAKQIGELRVFIDQSDRAHLRGHGTIHAKLSVTANVQGASTGPSTVSQGFPFTIGR